MTLPEELAKARYDLATADVAGSGWTTLTMQQRANLCDLMRKTLRVGHNPTTEMLIAGAEQVYARHDYPMNMGEQQRQDIARDVWQAMLTEILR